MSSDLSKLLDCPFCGGKATIKHKHYKGKLMRMGGGVGYWGTPEDGRTLFWVGCHDNNNCLNPKSYGDKKEAILLWNTRAI